MSRMLFRSLRGARVLAFVLASFAMVSTLLTPSPSLAVGGVTGSIRGRLVDTKSGSAVIGAAVAATSPSGSFKATTDGNGLFEFLQIPSDTYIVSFQKQGYEPRSLTGVTVLGDATVDLGSVSSSKSLTQIARVTARSATSAFQPSQTQDTYSVSGQRITQALGNSYSTDEATLLQSVPGVIQTFDSGNMGATGQGLSVRGSLGVELGYQFDGVPFTAPFFDENGSQGFLNNLAGGSGGSIQVVSGAGDATQGNSGGGTINTVSPRGTYPGAATLDLEVGSPYYNHTLNFNDSFATQNGRISNFFAYSGSRFVPQYAPFGASANTQSLALNATAEGLTGGGELPAYLNSSLIAHDDLMDNFVFRFGNNGNQSIQVLERNADYRSYAGYGGLAGLAPFNAIGGGFLTGIADGSVLTGSPTPSLGFPSQAYVEKLLAPVPYQLAPGTPQTVPDTLASNPLQFLKIAYTNNLNATTYFSTTYYNWGLYQTTSSYSNFNAEGYNGTAYAQAGGSRTGVLADLTKTIGGNQTVTLEGKYEDAKPFEIDEQPGYGPEALEIGAVTNSGYPSPSDWYLPANTTQPVSASNPCLGAGGTLAAQTTNGAGGCYLYSQLLASGKWTGQLPLIPTWGVSYHGTNQQQWGLGFRDQYSPTSKVHLDFGVRVDGENNKFGEDQYGTETASDVEPGKLNNDFLRPREIEPRAAVSWQLGPNDSVRASYGRSTLFFFGQTLGTPINLYDLNPIYADIAAKDSASNPLCGSGTHGPGAGYSTNSGGYQNPYANGTTRSPSYFYQCPNYENALVSLYDQTLDAPDLGGYGPPTYNNYDFAYSHQFSKGFLRGWAAHTTAYARTGYNVEQNTLLANGAPNPITGQTAASVFATTADGSEHTFGVEENITTPDIPRGGSGISGYLTFDYINEYLNTPPVAGSSNLPILAAYLLGTGQYFHEGFIPPLSFSTGATYQMKNGLRITPSILANLGYPIGVGRSTEGFVNGVQYVLPETNFGQNVPYAGPNGPNQAYNASYFVDPQVPGSALHPVIVGSRGFNEPSLAGNAYSNPQAYVNLNLEYPITKNVTIGASAFNLFNNVFAVPVVNTTYQAVATGVQGPHTGQIATALPYGSSYLAGSADQPYTNGGNQQFLTGYGAGLTFNVYGRFKI